VAEAGRRPMEALAREYAAELMGALKRRATRRAHANVLQHLLGYVSERLDSADRREMAGLIEQYRQGLVPLVVPLTLLKYHLRRHREPYLERQHYLNPYPETLGLRNVL
ncbi:YbgA family protein, partial [Pelomicrobium methylotrophicum]